MQPSWMNRIHLRHSEHERFGALQKIFMSLFPSVCGDYLVNRIADMEDWQLLENYVGRNSDMRLFSNSSIVTLLCSFGGATSCRKRAACRRSDANRFYFVGTKGAGVLKRRYSFRLALCTTRFVASRAVRSEQRRQRREQEAYEMQQLNHPDETWKRIEPILDEALGVLGATDRNAVLLRFFNDKSFREKGRIARGERRRRQKAGDARVGKVADIFLEAWHRIVCDDFGFGAIDSFGERRACAPCGGCHDEGDCESFHRCGLVADVGWRSLERVALGETEISGCKYRHRNLLPPLS